MLWSNYFGKGKLFAGQDGAKFKLAVLTFLINFKLSSKEKKSIPVPWRGIFTSPYVYAIILPHFASNWGNYTLLTMLPTYMATVLKFDLSAVSVTYVVFFHIIFNTSEHNF